MTQEESMMTGDTPLSMSGEDTTLLVTESLLSGAKDLRYVRQLQSLLEQAAEPLFSGSMVTTNKLCWYAAHLSYLLLVVVPRGRTLGMAATGLEFKKDGNRSQWIAVVLTMTMGIGAALDWWATAPDRDEEPQSEVLRGHDRRERHEALRQQMLQRASSCSSSSSSRQSTAVVGSTQRLVNDNIPLQSNGDGSLQGQLKSALRKVIKSMSEVTAEYSREGPHTIQPTTGATSTRSLVSWILKVHLAQYLVTGKFRNVFHRLIGLKLKREDGAPSRVPVQPNTHRVIAMLIALQASSTLIRFVTRICIDGVAQFIEGSVGEKPSKVIKKSKDNSNSRFHSNPRTSQSTCGICRTERTHPASASSCGHVFCWNCLTQWMATVKEACPYCRAPCRLEDIQPLYNYDPVLSDTSS